MSCLQCDRPHRRKGEFAPMGMLIRIGFGTADVTRDGITILDGEHMRVPIPSGVGVRAAERRSARVWNRLHRRLEDPDGNLRLAAVERYISRLGRRLTHRYEVAIHGPLWSARWLRVGPSRWVCVERGDGFA